MEAPPKAIHPSKAKRQLLRTLRRRPEVVKAFVGWEDVRDEELLAAVAHCSRPDVVLLKAGVKDPVYTEYLQSIVELSPIAVEAPKPHFERKLQYWSLRLCCCGLLIVALICPMLYHFIFAAPSWRTGTCEIFSFTNSSCTEQLGGCFLNIHIKTTKEGSILPEEFDMRDWAPPVRRSYRNPEVARFEGEGLRCCDPNKECCELFDRDVMLFCDNWAHARDSEGLPCPSEGGWKCSFRLSENGDDADGDGNPDVVELAHYEEPNRIIWVLLGFSCTLLCCLYCAAVIGFMYITGMCDCAPTGPTKVSEFTDDNFHSDPEDVAPVQVRRINADPEAPPTFHEELPMRAAAEEADEAPEPPEQASEPDAPIPDAEPVQPPSSAIRAWRMGSTSTDSTSSSQAAPPSEPAAPEEAFGYVKDLPKAKNTDHCFVPIIPPRSKPFLLSAGSTQLPRVPEDRIHWRAREMMESSDIPLPTFNTAAQINSALGEHPRQVRWAQMAADKVVPPKPKEKPKEEPTTIRASVRRGGSVRPGQRSASKR